MGSAALTGHVSVCEFGAAGDFLQIIYREAKYEIVDYKFISPASGQSLERFFAENTKRYQEQLQHYQKLLALAEGIDFENDEIEFKKILRVIFKKSFYSKNPK